MHFQTTLFTLAIAGIFVVNAVPAVPAATLEGFSGPGTLGSTCVIFDSFATSCVPIELKCCNTETFSLADSDDVVGAFMGSFNDIVPNRDQKEGDAEADDILGALAFGIGANKFKCLPECTAEALAASRIGRISEN
jgi:hypothetical protein